jgi:hypothetical protein
MLGCLAIAIPFPWRSRLLGLCLHAALVAINGEVDVLVN